VTTDPADVFATFLASATEESDDVACIPLPAAGSVEPLPEVPGLLAGAAEVDVTPPPGMPKSGHSRNAQDGTGFRTRLRVRAVHLRAGRVSLGLVAGDMHAGSAVVHRLVAAAVRGRTDIPMAGLFMGATHTHAGPGQFHGSDFYNRWASNRPGLDPDYTAFLSERIAGAVQEAYDSRRPARLAFGSTEVWGFTRNRSLQAHVHNASVPDKRLAAQRRYAAVNPWLHLLRVDADDPSGGLSPLAALAFFSIHGTGISRHDPAYNADVWAYITGEMARGIEARTGVRPVAGAVEGTHGDMTPAVRPGMLVYPEAERVGRGIGAAAADLHARLEPALTGNVRLAAGYREIDLANGPVIAGIRLPDPAIGTAKLAGAVENSTPLLEHIPPFRPGFPKPPALARTPQGPKWIFGGRRLQLRFAPVSAFPHVLPVQVMLVGPMALLALPFEITVEAGRRLEAEVGHALTAASAAPERVVVSSAANDYWDYLTTPEEYDRQCYEGASNLYGPNTLRFVGSAAADLATRLLRGELVDESVSDRTFRGQVHRYMALTEGAGAGPGRQGHGDGRAVFFEADRWEDAYWEWRWNGGAPGTMRWDRPMARVEHLTEDGSWVTMSDGTGPVDDRGWHVGVFHVGSFQSGGGRDTDVHTYAARWYQPPLGIPGRYRFALEANHGQPELVGEAFD
jgi:neutral ceramidase